jgi:hypothetical protein
MKHMNGYIILINIGCNAVTSASYPSRVSSKAVSMSSSVALFLRLLIINLARTMHHCTNNPLLGEPVLAKCMLMGTYINLWLGGAHPKRIVSSLACFINACTCMRPTPSLSTTPLPSSDNKRTLI